MSRDKNTVRPFKESFNVVKSLIALNREIMYVAGNHDDIVGITTRERISLAGCACMSDIQRMFMENRK